MSGPGFQRVPHSRIAVLTGAGRQADDRILDAFALQGVSSRRVTLLGKAPREGYFQLYQGVDIALDPFPCVGCNTTADALWMGAPVVSLAGKTCFNRQGVGPLTLVGLKDLVVETPDAYVEAAVKLAGDVRRLGELRGSLRERMRRSPLTDVRRFTRQLEEAYQTMWQRYLSPGLPHDLICFSVFLHPLIPLSQRSPRHVDQPLRTKTYRVAVLPHGMEAKAQATSPRADGCCNLACDSGPGWKCWKIAWSLRLFSTP